MAHLTCAFASSMKVKWLSVPHALHTAMPGMVSPGATSSFFSRFPALGASSFLAFAGSEAENFKKTGMSREGSERARVILQRRDKAALSQPATLSIDSLFTTAAATFLEQM